MNHDPPSFLVGQASTQPLLGENNWIMDKFHCSYKEFSYKAFIKQ